MGVDDERLLDELRDRYRSTWWFSYPELEPLAQRAAAKGCLHWAVDAAEARAWNAMGSSSNSSATTVAFGADGPVTDREAFALILLDELGKAVSGE